MRFPAGVFKLRLVIAAVFVVAVLAYVLWSSPQSPERYDPIVLENGSVEYRLVNRGNDLRYGTEDDQHWVLHFSAETLVEPLEAYLERRFGKKRDPRFKYNRNLNIFVRLPDFGRPMTEYPRTHQTTLNIDLVSTYEDYDRNTGMEPDTLLFSHMTFACRKVAEIHPGVFRLRDTTDDEKQIIREKYGERAAQFGKTCGVNAATSKDYYLVDREGHPAGFGECSEGHFSNPVEQCSFHVWLPNNRGANYRFNGKYLPMLQDIHAHVVQLLDGATDRSKSLNIQ